PESGRLTGDDTGVGRMSEPEQILVEVLKLLRAQDLSGRDLLITAGGTREPLDPVRFLGNRSIGRQGAALAKTAAERGARVTLIACNIDEALLAHLRNYADLQIISAVTTAELQREVEDRIGISDALIMAAAVADYRPASVQDGKIRKEDGSEAG